ncbi:MAG: DeoR/GlpR family DNA-binding transcription regulator [Treponema sp.]|jgi:DeoR/GlpR family transcriptional regulator of sugar metabolism|nr:DeoR/GlpR family DNA-binding transcription regulator [Treponema sp.]
MTNRQCKILDVLTTRQKIEVAALAGMFSVSQVTIRKDLTVLEEQGLVRREHGYASIDLGKGPGTCVAYNYNVKKRIAVRAAAAVEDGETVFIESDSICALLAEELVNTGKDVTIVTNSVFIANHTPCAPNGKLILLGGFFEQESQVTVGPMTCKCGEIFFSDKFFLGVEGFSESFGFTGRDLVLAETIQSLSDQARNIIVLTESEKFKMPGVVGLLRADKVAAVYTDDEIPLRAENYLHKNDVEIQKVPRKAE